MRKLIVQQWVTADNIVAEPDGGLSSVAGEPFDDEVTDNPIQNSLMGFIDSVDTMILGANTYNQTKDYWPNATEQGRYGEKLNSLSKVVASATMQEAPWGRFPAAAVTRDPVATIRELKEEEGKDLWLWGSLKLMFSLQDARVIDEVRMLVCPTTTGAGVRLFSDRRDLQLLEATRFDNGVALMRYALKN